MKHALMYQGSYEDNYPVLRPGAQTFRGTDGSERELPEWPDDVDGVRVGYMEKSGKRFVGVRLQFEEHDVVLQTPVVLDPIRHLGSRRFSPEPTVITDDLASALLDDVIECNKEQTDELARLINRVNQVRRGQS
jgi:hypothetical protein